MAAKPISRRAGRFFSKRPTPKSWGIVDGSFGSQGSLFFKALLDLGSLVTDMQ